MRVCEIFSSIDGEGHHAGGLATFVRFGGCNLKCAYCDSAFACDAQNVEELTVDEVVAEVKKRGNKHVTLTGGEPLLQHDLLALVDRLVIDRFSVNIETNGSLSISDLAGRNCVITMDIKTPISKMQSFNFYENINKLRESDVLKFVTVPKTDADFIYNTLTQSKPKCSIYLSPVYGSASLLDCVNLLRSLKDRVTPEIVERVKIQVQLHKIAGIE
jgi:7-carboxy-7-deazaguanine synthase